jgi:hypothetical protein
MITDIDFDGRADPSERISVDEIIIVPSEKSGLIVHVQFPLALTILVQVWPLGQVLITFDPGVAPFQEILGVESFCVELSRGERKFRVQLELQLGAQRVLRRKFVPRKTIFQLEGIVACHWKYQFPSIIAPEKFIYQNIPDHAYQLRSQAQVFWTHAILGLRFIHP